MIWPYITGAIIFLVVGIILAAIQDFGNKKFW